MANRLRRRRRRPAVLVAAGANSLAAAEVGGEEGNDFDCIFGCGESQNCLILVLVLIVCGFLNSPNSSTN